MLASDLHGGVEALLTTAKDRFGIESFRPGQADTLQSVLDSNNTLAIMPTGAGKSLCYQLPASHLTSITLVVSPLIALMKDQHEKLKGLGIRSLRFDSTLGQKHINEAQLSLEQGGPCVAFVTPERLMNADFRAQLQRVEVGLFVVDEAHCISQWGHDFRPAYLGLGEAVRSLGSPPVLALTATAPPKVQADILQQLGIPSAKIINTGLERKNLRYSVQVAESESNKQHRLVRFLAKQPGRAIVYAATIKNVDAIAKSLQSEGIDCAPYHGRLTPKERDQVHNNFMTTNSPRVMVATNAFGLGVDKGDIRAVVHYNFPGSLEAYYQEAGRAGRDGINAECLLLYRSADKRIQDFFLGGRYPTPEQTFAVADALIQLHAEHQRPQQLKDIALRADAPIKKTRVILSFLEAIDCASEDHQACFVPAKQRVPSVAELEAATRSYDDKQRGDHGRLELMLRYAETTLCRTWLLLNYFGCTEAGSSYHCGHCDNCESEDELSYARAARSAGPELARLRAQQRAEEKQAVPDPAKTRAIAEAIDQRRKLKRPRSMTVEKKRPTSASGFLQGDVVHHAKWGEGEILRTRHDSVYAYFPGHGEKLLKARFLERVR